MFSTKIVTVHSYFLFFCMVRNGNCPGYPLRTVIWGKTVFYAGHTHAKSHAYSCNCEHTPCYYMGKHKTCFTSSRSRSWHIEDSRRVCLFHGPEPICIWFLQCLVKFLQTQNIVFPMMICSGITTLLHILICWFMVFKSSLGFRGAALANSISNWINVFLLVLYVKFSPSCAKTWAGFSKEAFHNIFTFLRLAIPSAIMVW